MPVPTFDQFIEPILRHLAAHPEGVPAHAAHEAAAGALGLSAEQRQEQIGSGQATYKNRSGWAHDRLKRAGLSTSPRRGYWKLTDAGIAYAREHASPLPAKEVERLATANVALRLGNNDPQSKPAMPDIAPPSIPPGAPVSPEERLEQALQELRDSAAADLLESLKRASPLHFENIVLDVLHALGYGASRDDLQRVGGSGDGGIDGVISLDKLGLEKVYVQAKRWKENTVGRPDLQAFYGALAGQRAKRGVFITTSSFTPQAQDFAKSVEGIVLVDGARLVHLMIEHEVGVSSRIIKVPKLDSDYFDEDS
ncbi:restriction endonuclease [Solimonas variicoloris]|uniref:restriction endonuclease n=1 Tax=Solimonas variicoloris TaxID=254408 RepID=UPI00036EB6D0|nr:restriction endonuclease [Solimonas variicoloris]